MVCFLTHFWPKFQFYTPRKQLATKGFLLFSGDMKWEQWSEIGQELTQSGPKLNRFFKTLLHSLLLSTLFPSQLFPWNFGH